MALEDVIRKLKFKGEANYSREKTLPGEGERIPVCPRLSIHKKYASSFLTAETETKKEKKYILFSRMGKLQNLILMFFFKHLNASFIGNVLRVNVEISSALISLSDLEWS